MGKKMFSVFFFFFFFEADDVYILYKCQEVD